MEKMMSTKNLITNKVFLIALIILFVNDHYLKYQYHNWLTGKISDFAGLLIFPVFLRFLFPSVARFANTATALLFIFWKTPLSGGFIECYNHFSFIPVTRVVDYSDFIALLVLPLSNVLCSNAQRFEILALQRSRMATSLMIVVCSLVFMATSPPLSYYMSQPGGDIFICKQYKVKKTEAEILQLLKNEGFNVQKELEGIRDISFYSIHNITIPNGKDSIKGVSFSICEMEKHCIVQLNYVTLTNKPYLGDWRTLRYYSNMYRNLLKNSIIEPIKKQNADKQ